MGTYLFTWAHEATDVVVTGTFDNWSHTNKLEKKGDRFEKLVALPSADEKVFYKFLVDGEWKLDHTAPQENDGHNNLNNVLTPDHITKTATSHSPAAAIMSGITPNSTTAALANKVPKESDRETENATISSAAPTSTTAGLAKDVPLEKDTKTTMPGDFPATPQAEPSAFSVNPLPATSGIGNPIKLEPGEKVPDSSTLTKNTVSSTVENGAGVSKEGEAKTFGVNPLPPTAGIGNPIQLKPGEKVPDPSTFTSNTIASTARTDEGSFKKADDLSVASSGTASKAAATGKEGGMFSVPPASKSMIPESSLPMGSGAGASFEKDPGVTVSSAAPGSTTAGLAAGVPLEPKTKSDGVPEIVRDSQAEAHASPEASASPEMVKEKAATEQELKKEIAPEPEASAKSESEKKEKTAGLAAGGAAALAGGAVAAATYGAKGKGTKTTEPASTDGHVDGVPAVVEKSMAKAHKEPEAAGNEEAVVEKKAVEQELLKEIKPSQSSGEPAPTLTAATTEKAPEPTSQKTGHDSRDISPMSRPHGETAAIATSTTKPETSTPVKSTKAEPTTAGSSSTPTKATETTESSTPSTSTADKKKKNRLSIFDKIKSKIHHK